MCSYSLHFSSSPTHVSPLEYQFNFPDADIVLQTNDHSEFCVHYEFHSCQRLLSSAICLLFLKVSEPSDVLDTSLRLVYSTPDPNTISSFDEHVLETFPSKTSHFFTALFTNIAYLGICVSFLVWTWRRWESFHDNTLSINMLDALLLWKTWSISLDYSYHRLLNFPSSAIKSLVQNSIDDQCMQCNGSVYTLDGSPQMVCLNFEKAC